MRLLTRIFSLFSLRATVAITVAAAVNYALSFAIFPARFVDIIDMVVIQTLRSNSMDQFNLVRADYHRLMKMKGFWPPHEHPSIAWGYSFGLFLLFTKVMLKDADYSIRPHRRDNSLFLAQSIGVRILNSLVAGGFLFSVLFPLYRLGEMHFVVIGMNLIHFVITCTCSNFVFSLLLRPFARIEKEKEN
ncbi:hypothetical protein PMAYCL1PPCAC_11264 [Pristionchus mayeri]|uniref:Uncharacterized protein n=1 Tax=Pristionchus mayeri TaxID=1317129 RepID=A0AAN4ZKL3_9BILA|nr:hypothetical protein PMAYCL1PPCAC_11264 [Pristionchus mayeri]